MGNNFLSFPQQLHYVDRIIQRLRQRNVLRLYRGQCYLHLQLAAPYDQAAGVQDGVAGPVLVSAWIVDGGRAMLVSKKVGVGVHLKSLAYFGFQRDSLHPCGLEVLDQVDYRVPV